jgi:nucleoside-diphosphate-sugar epimerase
VPAGTYDVGTGIGTTLELAAQIACQEAGPGAIGRLWPTGDTASAYAQHYPLALDGRWLPGWEPHVLLRDGLRHTAAWCREHEPVETRAAVAT